MKQNCVWNLKCRLKILQSPNFQIVKLCLLTDIPYRPLWRNYELSRSLQCCCAQEYSWCASRAFGTGQCVVDVMPYNWMQTSLLFSVFSAFLSVFSLLLLVWLQTKMSTIAISCHKLPKWLITQHASLHFLWFCAPLITVDLNHFVKITWTHVMNAPLFFH